MILLFLSCTQNIEKSKAEKNCILAETSQHLFSHQGIDREYWLHIPEGTQEGAPILVVMHGYTSQAKVIMEYSGFNEIADIHKFVVLYPQGTIDQFGHSFFHVGYDFHTQEEVDDFGFIASLVSHIQSEYSLSLDTVFGTGMSNGGDMSYAFACSSSNIFRAIAPVAGTMMTSVYETCSPQQSIPVFEIHGTSDSVTLWNGDPTNEYGWGAYLDIPSVISFWTNANEVTLEEERVLDDSNTQDGSDILFHKYGTDTDDTQVWLYEVRNGEHDWPGAFGNMDIDASVEVWNFFDQYRQDH